MGLNEASTFPAFCSEHERLFEDFETIKDFRTGEHLLLQLYRKVCREIVMNENQINSSITFTDNYKTFRNKKIKEVVLKNLGEEVLQIPNLDFKSVDFENKDGTLSLVDEQIKRMQRYLNDFLYLMREGLK